MKYYIIAGEASGDLHGSNLMKEIKLLDNHATFRFWGGDRMLAQGGELVKHINHLAFMGFWEVFMNLPTILGNLKLCKTDLLYFRPDVLILIDYPGFNLRMASFAKKNGIKVVYYISPQIWAWKQSRVKKIRRDVDKMMVILPFEQAFYKGFGVDVEFPGHPLLDAISQYQQKESNQDFLKQHGLTEKPIVALLPGSRRQELSATLQVMASVANSFLDFQFVVAGLNSIPESFYHELIAGSPVKLVYGQTYNLLAHSTAALVTSGTATLETALFGVPQVVCYRAGVISYLIAKKLVKVKYISLVNLVLDRPLVREMIQGELTRNGLINELNSLLYDKEYIARINYGYLELKKILGGEGASRNAAKIIASFIKPD